MSINTELIPLFPSATHSALPFASQILSTLRQLTAPGKGNDLKPEESAALVGISALLGCERSVLPLILSSFRYIWHTDFFFVWKGSEQRSGRAIRSKSQCCLPCPLSFRPHARPTYLGHRNLHPALLFSTCFASFFVLPTQSTKTDSSDQPVPNPEEEIQV